MTSKPANKSDLEESSPEDREVRALTIGDISARTILPDTLALFVSRLSYVGTFSIRSSALLAEAALEGARFGTITGLELGRRTLEGLMTGVFDMLVQDSNNFGSVHRGAFGTLVEKYSELGVVSCRNLTEIDLSGAPYVFAGGVA
jgi:hypothetical protein